MNTGLVVSSHGRHCVLECEDGSRLQAHPRGKRLEVVVGDRVDWAPTQLGQEDQAVIESVQPRRNLLHRQDLWRTKSFAANLDQVGILACGQPMFSESQLMRALVACDAAGISAFIIHNKIDLPSAAEAQLRLKPYVEMGILLLPVSVKLHPEQARERLWPQIQGRTTLLLGASGTGKSSLLNLLVPDAASRVGDISMALQAGRHTTTHTSWHWVDAPSRTTALIDSPGFQEFGLRQVAAPDLAGHLPDFRPLLGQCRFSNCMHHQEPGCAVTQAVAQGLISAHRHRLYLDILGELQQTRWSG